jgi:3D (Asp-Asp-Asp) domain-containing protein
VFIANVQRHAQIAILTLAIAGFGWCAEIAHAPPNVLPAIVVDTGVIHAPQSHPVVATRFATRSRVATPAPIFEGTALLTAYTSQDDAGMRGDGITASGAPARRWTTAAAWPAIPFGSRVVVEYEDGRVRHYIVEDRGGAIGYAHLDIYVGAGEGARAEAMEFGRQYAKVKIYAP